jgi:hypothetical protein
VRRSPIAKLRLALWLNPGGGGMEHEVAFQGL